MATFVSAHVPKKAAAPLPKGDLCDWVPGDGLVCFYGSTWTICDLPVKTLVDSNAAWGRRKPLCTEHAGGGPVRPHGGPFSAANRKAALEQIIAAHWDEYVEALKSVES